MKRRMQFYTHQYSIIVILTRIEQNETGRMVANGKSSLHSVERRITRLDFFELGEPAKDFLDTNTRKSVLDKFRMLEMRLR